MLPGCTGAVRRTAEGGRGRRPEEAPAVVAATRARDGTSARIAGPVAQCVGPSAFVLLALTTHGAPAMEQVRALELDAPNIIEGHGSVFEYLGDTFATSWQRVVERSNPELSIMVGLLLVAICSRSSAARSSTWGRSRGGTERCPTTSPRRGAGSSRSPPRPSSSCCRRSPTS
jgi:hypothetical protein